MNSYILSLLAYVFGLSLLDLSTNKYYARSWRRADVYKKGLLVYYLLLHNVIYFVIYFSIFFLLYNFHTTSLQYFVAYFLLLVAVPLHWYTNNNRCWFTERQNELLGIDKGYAFRDTYSVLTNQHFKANPIRDNIYLGYLIVCIVASIAMMSVKASV